MQNYGTVHITGLDATLATSIPVCPNINVGLSGNYSWQKAIDMTNPDVEDVLFGREGQHRGPVVADRNVDVEHTPPAHP